MKIGKIQIDGYAGLAPMAGVADRAFREVCRNFGATYTVGEMVSSKGVTMGDKKSKQLMYIPENEHPSAIQIFGNNPEIMAECAKTSLEFHPDIIDINMGCPAPKIIKNQSGSRLMQNPGLAGEIIKAVTEAVNIPVTVKIRTGWDFDSINAPLMAEIAQLNGAAAVTVHGRTKEQMYAPGIDFETIANVKKSVTIPVIGNGDVDNPVKCAEMYEKTNCDYVLIGRGALGRPWLFSQINAYLNETRIYPEPSITEKMLTMLKHIEKLCEYNGDKTGLREARKHSLWYTKGIRGSSEYRRRLSTVSSLDELRKIAFQIANENNE